MSYKIEYIDGGGKCCIKKVKDVVTLNFLVNMYNDNITLDKIKNIKLLNGKNLSYVTNESKTESIEIKTGDTPIPGLPDQQNLSDYIQLRGKNFEALSKEYKLYKKNNFKFDSEHTVIKDIRGVKQYFVNRELSWWISNFDFIYVADIKAINDDTKIYYFNNLWDIPNELLRQNDAAKEKNDNTPEEKNTSGLFVVLKCTDKINIFRVKKNLPLPHFLDGDNEKNLVEHITKYTQEFTDGKISNYNIFKCITGDYEYYYNGKCEIFKKLHTCINVAFEKYAFDYDKKITDILYNKIDNKSEQEQEQFFNEKKILCSGRGDGDKKIANFPIINPLNMENIDEYFKIRKSIKCFYIIIGKNDKMFVIHKDSMEKDDWYKLKSILEISNNIIRIFDKFIFKKNQTEDENKQIKDILKNFMKMDRYGDKEFIKHLLNPIREEL